MITGFELTGTVSQVNPFSIMHFEEQPSPSTVLPSSHSLPSPANRRPLPQTFMQPPPATGHLGSIRQKGEQPSPVTLLPSSHCSEPSGLPLPQTLVVQVVGPTQPPAPPSAAAAAVGDVHNQPSA